MTKKSLKDELDHALELTENLKEAHERIDKESEGANESLRKLVNSTDYQNGSQLMRECVSELATHINEIRLALGL